MGNRAVITTEKRDLGIYLHWNGGRDSVEAFLEYCKLRGFRAPEHDCYGWARMCQVVSNFFGADGLSVGIQRYTTDERMDPGDNGIYIIKNWEIVDRVYPYEPFHEQMEYDRSEMLQSIDEAQPKHHQLGGYLTSQTVPVDELQIGDIVYMPEINEPPKPYEVIGFGTRDAVNGCGYLGKPYVDKYGKSGNDPEMNCNNYPHCAWHSETCRIVPRPTDDGTAEVIAAIREVSNVRAAMQGVLSLLGEEE